MHPGIPAPAALVAGALVCPSAGAQFGFGVDAGEGPNSSFTVWDRNFQYGYRDPLGGGSGFSSSDGLAVTSVP